MTGSRPYREARDRIRRAHARRERRRRREWPNPEFDPARHATPESDIYPFEIEKPGWSIVGVARGKGDDERVFELERSAVVWREIDDASQLDPPNPQPPDRPRPRTDSTDLSSYPESDLRS